MQQAASLTIPYCREVGFTVPDAKGFVIIDSFLGGGGTGGIRMGQGVTQQEVADLAREMSLKFAWLNIPRGGAKAGICLPAGTGQDDKTRILTEFGEGIADLLREGKYVAGLDLGVGPAELAGIMAGAGRPVSGEQNEVQIDSNFYTALTVFTALEALLDQKGKQVEGLTFLLEGIGKVGGHLLRLIEGAGGKIVGASTIRGALMNADGIDARALIEARDKFGDECVLKLECEKVIASADLYWQPADVLIPGARTNSISEDDVSKLKVGYVVSIANAVASPGAEVAMHDAGIAYLPGFVANSGGIFCWYLARLEREARIRLITEAFKAKVRRLVAAADRRGISYASLAREQAESKASRMRAETSGPAWARAFGQLRKLAPQRLAYLVLRRVLGDGWANRYSVFCRLYFDSRYFS